MQQFALMKDYQQHIIYCPNSIIQNDSLWKFSPWILFLVTTIHVGKLKLDTAVYPNG